MRFLESIINMKLNNIGRDELMGLAKQHGVSLTPDEAARISRELRGKNYNLFNVEQRKHVMNQIAAIIGRDRAKQVEQIFLSFTGR